MPSRRAASCRAFGTVLVGVLVVAACSGDDATPPTTVPATIPATTTTRPDDGVFRIGAVVPSGGSVPDLGVSIRAGLQAAANDINSLGVRGQQVAVDVRDEGDSPASALTAVQSLIDSGVDAIVGPTSSLNLLSTLPTAVKAGVLTCSPTASAMSLDGFPDQGLFFRTVPSDSLQAVGIAKLASDVGSSRIVIAYADDAYGRPFADTVGNALAAGGTTAQAFGFPTGKVPPPDTVTAIVAEQPDVVIVLADATVGPAIITAVDTALSDGTAPRGANAVDVQYVVNDAMRRLDPNTTMPADLVRRISGVAPRAYPPAGSVRFLDELRAADPSAGGLFAMNAYDCLTLIALGATTADSFDGAAIHGQLSALTSSGRSCATFSDCVTFAASTPNINYNGPSGALTIDGNGDPSGTTFEVFRTNPATGEEIVSTLPIGAE